MKKKLQIFISSTYTDLIEERQAAVQAVLDAGHIPAGMELFKAGNKSQLETIKRWIDDSDVYMLILGGRYGSIEETSGKSYTQVEYEYAIKKEIPVFAVILNEQFLYTKASKQGKETVFEADNLTQYDAFKSYVMTKVIRPVEDSKDIKLAIHTTLSEFIDEYDLVGWVKGNCISHNDGLLAENKELAKENLRLIKEMNKIEKQLGKNSTNKIGDYSFEQLIEIFTKHKLTIPVNTIGNDKEVETNALKFFEVYFDHLCSGVTNRVKDTDESKFIYFKIAPYFISFGLLERTKLAGTTAQRIQTSKLGAKFYGMLESSKLKEE